MMDFAKYKYVTAAAVALCQTAVLGYMIESRALILRNGHEVVLQTIPVDPRDLLRGDYVVLGYPMAQVSVSAIEGVKPVAQNNATVHAVLKKNDTGTWSATRYSWQPFAGVAADEVMIAGRTPDYFSTDASATVSLNFGIERFYVPEGEGKAIEEGQAEKAVQVTVAVDNSGQAQIKSLSLEGQTLYEEPLY